MGLWIGGRLSTADEPSAIRFIGNFSGHRAMGDHEVKHPWRGLSRRSRPPSA